jgi:hypothetical protein
MPGCRKLAGRRRRIEAASIVRNDDGDALCAVVQADVNPAGVRVLPGIVHGFLRDAKQRHLDLGAQAARDTLDTKRARRCARHGSGLLAQRAKRGFQPELLEVGGAEGL